MGIGISIFLFAVGAILAFAVEATTEGINLDMVGVILMLVGGIGLLFSLLAFGDNGLWRRRDGVAVDRRVDRVAVDRPVDRVVYTDRDVYDRERI